jgi:hypothetical protein
METGAEIVGGQIAAVEFLGGKQGLRTPVFGFPLEGVDSRALWEMVSS